MVSTGPFASMTECEILPDFSPWDSMANRKPSQSNAKERSAAIVSKTSGGTP